MRSITWLSAAVGVVVVAAACGGDVSGTGRWAGSIDTLPSGTVVVSNPATGIWDSASTWRVTETLRVGAADGTGPDVFGRITALEADRAGRLYVFEGQAQELRIFDSSGRYVRTVGRKGGGPGEFKQAMGMAWAPDGDLWIPDPSNNRISLIDTSGTYVGEKYLMGGFVMMPWPGGFDRQGNFYNFSPDRSANDFGIVMVRYDTALNPLDTIRVPKYDSDNNYFELRTDGGFIRTDVPFSPGLQWKLGPDGGIWFALTGEYKLFQRSAAGDTLRIISRAFEPLPVTSTDVDSAIAGLEWFTKQGGKVDRSKLPSVKPAIRTFFLDGQGDVWVVPVVAAPQGEGSATDVMDVFDEGGRYLGRVMLPVPLSQYPRPVFRDGLIYGVTKDELEVPYVVVLEVQKPGVV